MDNKDDELPDKDAAKEFYARYEPKEILGRGVSSTVRRCVEKETGMEFAAKIIDLSNDPENRGATLEEINILRMVIGHEYIIHLHDVFESETFIFLVFELCRNGELFDYLTNVVTLSEKKTRYIMRQLFEALQHVHRQGVVHRDIKPENILLDDALDIKLTDFGFASVLKPNQLLRDESQFNVVRVGSGQKYDPNSPIVDVMLDTVIKQKMGNPLNEANRQCQSNNLFIYTNKKDLENEILINTEVIVTTLNSCFSKTMEEAFKPSNIKSLNNCHFTACIVDEAGQSIEPLIFVPILLGIDKLILVGDDKQLQPLVKSKVAKDNGLGISLFKRLKTWFEQKRSTRKSFPVIMLNTQYRMHYEICLFPSKYFYNGEIKTAPSVKMRKQLSFHPYMILEHESLQDNTGEVNIGEANMIVTLVDILLNSECRSLTIAVLTPYHKQREQINILLKKKKISLNVNTIDSFQGGECDVLLISTVRTNGVGFMDDICRLNVALTRAKQSLIICGNFMSLRGERVWSDLIEDAKERKLIKKVSKKVITNSRVLLAMIKL